MPRPAKSFEQQIAEADASLLARDRAGQTPREVRRAFLAKRHAAGPVAFQPFSLGMLWLLEELDHPFNEPTTIGPDGAPVARVVTVRDTSRAIYIFSDPVAADEALAGGLAGFDAAALEIAAGIAPARLGEISAELKAVFDGGMATIPGGGLGGPSTDAMGPEKGSGNGWTLTVLDAIFSEYGWPTWKDRLGRVRDGLDWIVWNLPLARVFALYAAIAPRYGVEPKGPTYIEAAMIRAKREVEDAFARSAADGLN